MDRGVACSVARGEKWKEVSAGSVDISVGLLLLFGCYCRSWRRRRMIMIMMKVENIREEIWMFWVNDSFVNWP